MSIVKIKTIQNRNVSVTEEELHRAVIDYLRKESPHRVKIIAEHVNKNGQPEYIPAAILMLAKNPSEIKYYTDTVNTIPETEE